MTKTEILAGIALFVLIANAVAGYLSSGALPDFGALVAAVMTAVAAFHAAPSTAAPAPVVK